jgi:hypothetical protein
MTNPEFPSRTRKAAFADVGQVLDAVVGKLGLDRRLREQALFNLWPVLIENQFVSKTRPLYVDYENNLVVAVQDASVAQELTFHKREITNKLKRAGLTTGVRIEGLRIDLKHYHSLMANPQSDDVTLGASSMQLHRDPSFAQMEPDQQDLAAISLSEDQLAEIGQLQVTIESNLSTLNTSTAGGAKELAYRIGQILTRQIRLAKWRQMKGFPNCSRCGFSTGQLHTAEKICSYCYLQQEPKKA